MIKVPFAAVALAVLLSSCGSNDSAEQKAAPAEQAEPAIPAAASIATLAAPASREAALKLMHDRHADMKKIGGAMKATGRTLKSDTPDLAVIRKSAATVAGFAPKVPSWFPPGTGPDVGKTEAKAAIWQKPDDFTAKANDFNQAAQAFDAAAKAGDMAAIKDRFAAMGKTCKACHDPYRAEH